MFGKIFGSIVGGSVVSAAEGVANVIDKFVETDDEKRAAEIIKDRGRDAHFWAPPAQIRTCRIPAYGSYLECLTAKR